MCEMISYCGFDFYSLIISDAGHPLTYLLAICMSPSEQCFFHSPVHFFFNLDYLNLGGLIVCFVIELYESFISFGHYLAYI